jgi:hydroxyacid-oxoacid transhydrogenase
MTLSPYYSHGEGRESAFTVNPPRIKFGPGSLREVGHDAKALGMSRVALYTDKTVARLDSVATVKAALTAAGIDVAVFDEVEVEPTDKSFKAGIEFARAGAFDGFFSVGGGSSMDTAKAANLYTTYPPADFLDYVNAPIGKALPVPGPLKPHIACPTTFGTASECTAVEIFDLLEMAVKTGISNAQLRPALGVLDPDTLATLPGEVIAANGFDVFTHACESYTAIPYTSRARPDDPSARPVYQGANPYSDLSTLEAIRLIGGNLVEAVRQPGASQFREKLMFAGMLAGIGFGNSGVHIPHAMAYAVAGLVRDYYPRGWESNHPMVPHGTSVIVNAPAAFRFTGPACPERHFTAAEAMGADVRGAEAAEGGDLLADRIIEMMKETGLPNGIAGVGYGEEDIPNLVKGTLPQQRLLVMSPAPVGEAELTQLFKDAMRYW